MLMWRISFNALPTKDNMSKRIEQVTTCFFFGWNHIILEGDAKSCFDPLTSENISQAWTISNVVNNVLCLKHLFSVCRFCWVKRDCNAAAHAAAKLSLKFS